MENANPILPRVGALERKKEGRVCFWFFLPF